MAVALVALVIAAAGGAYAAGRASSSTITACVHRHGGTLYLAKKCAKHDKSLTWGVTGPTGPAGTTGPRGVTGNTGPAGPATGAAGGDLAGNYPNPTVDATKVQRRVTGTCSAPSAISSIHQDGTVGCQSPSPIVYAASTGTTATLTAAPGGVSGQAAELPLDGVVSQQVPYSPAISTAPPNGDDAQTFPTDETITGITLYVTMTTAVATVAPVTIKAELYTSSAPNDTFTPTSASTSVVVPPPVTVGETFHAVTTGLSVPVSAQTRGMIVISVSGSVVIQAFGVTASSSLTARIG